MVGKAWLQEPLRAVAAGVWRLLANMWVDQKAEKELCSAGFLSSPFLLL